MKRAILGLTAALAFLLPFALGGEKDPTAPPPAPAAPEGPGGEKPLKEPPQGPLLVAVDGADGALPVSFEVPRVDLDRLLSEGAIEDRGGGEGNRYRFLSSAKASAWFESARPLRPTVEEKARNPLKAVDESRRLTGPAFAPDGTPWFWRTDSWLKAEQVQPEVEAAAKGGSPRVVAGVRRLHVDSKGRVWAWPQAEPQRIVSFDPVSRKWIERKARPADPRGAHPAGDPRGRPSQFTGSVHEDTGGRLFFADGLGVHALDGESWSYQPFFDRNIEEKRFFGTITSFNDVRFAQDPAGAVHAWSVWGNLGWTGTIGLWRFDDGKWTNVDPVERIESAIPRSADEIWIVDDKAQLVLIEKGRRIEGERAQDALSPNLRFKQCRLAGAAKDGTSFLLLKDVTVYRPAGTDPVRAVALPPKGRPADLGKAAGEFLERTGDAPAVAPDGWIWGAGKKGLEGMSPDGRQFRSVGRAASLPSLAVRRFDARGSLYLETGGRVSLLDPDPSRDRDETGEGALPAMKTAVKGIAWPDSKGRMWCTLGGAGSRTAAFDGKTWQTFPEPAAELEKGDQRGFISAFPGPDGAMIFEDHVYRFHLFDAQGWVMEKTAAELASKHRARVEKALADPPAPGGNFYHHLVKDKSGRIWWAAWFDAWGVVDGEETVDGKAGGVEVGPNTQSVFGVLFPIGDGRRVLGSDERGHAAVLDVVDGQIAKVAEAPAKVVDRPPSGWLSNVLRDRSGRVWIMNGKTSVPIGEGGQAGEARKGWLALEDRRGGLWFKEEEGEARFLSRLDADGKEARLEIPGLLPGGSVAESPDGTAWTLTASHLIRIRAEGEKLSAIEKYRMPVTAWDRIWCDPKGRVWRLTSEPGSSDKPFLLRYATEAETKDDG